MHFISDVLYFSKVRFANKKMYVYIIIESICHKGKNHLLPKKIRS